MGKNRMRRLSGMQNGLLQGKRYSPDESLPFPWALPLSPAIARTSLLRTYVATPVCCPGIMPNLEGYTKEEITVSTFVPRAGTFISERKCIFPISYPATGRALALTVSGSIGNMEVLRVFLIRLIQLHFRLFAV